MGIRSFQGERAPVSRAFQANITVSDYMSKQLITFTPDQTLISVMEKLVKNKITGGPVINENNELLGIISDSDCMKQISESRYFNMPIGSTRIVSDYMSTEVETIQADTNVFDAASRFSKSPHRRFPVIENGKLVGQISQQDVLRAALKLSAEHWRDFSRVIA